VPVVLAASVVEERAQTLRQDQHLLMVQLTQAAVVEELLAQETLDQLNQPVPVDLELSSLGTLAIRLRRQLQGHHLQQEQRVHSPFRRTQLQCIHSQRMNL
jgi:putative ubiquitin-RnfH superfamily antitoxin RatB of RatAB toxin-antitoxin module